MNFNLDFKVLVKTGGGGGGGGFNVWKLKFK